jgi:ferritin
MALNKNIEKAFNEQLTREFYSSYLYWSMAAYFNSINLNGMAQWMNMQSGEEKMHAQKFYDFILSRGGVVELGAIDKPPVKWDSPLAAFEDALKHEQFITKNIHDLVELSMKEKDHAASSFLQWFVDEQVEEEDTTGEVVEKLKMIDNAPGALFMYDSVLGGRQAEAADN